MVRKGLSAPVGVDFNTLVRALKHVSQPGNVEAVTLSTADYTKSEAVNGFTVYVGTAGDITVDGAVSGTEVEFANVPSGTFLPIRCSKLYAAETTAGDLVVQW